MRPIYGVAIAYGILLAHYTKITLLALVQVLGLAYFHARRPLWIAAWTAAAFYAYPYWIKHTRSVLGELPPLEPSVLVTLAVAGLFLVSISAPVYVAFLFLRDVTRPVERVAEQPVRSRIYNPPNVEEVPGHAYPYNEKEMALREQLEKAREDGTFPISPEDVEAFLAHRAVHAGDV